MSQKKVDERKAAKKNHKQEAAKAKRSGILSKAIAAVCGACLVAGLGYSVYLKALPAKTVDAGTFSSITRTDRYGILNPSMPEK